MLVGFSVARLGRHGRFAADRQRASGRVGGGICLFVVMDDQGTVRAARAGGQGLVSRQSEKEGKEIVNAGGATGMPVYGFPFLRRVSSAASACHLRPAKELSCRGAWIPLRAGFGRLRAEAARVATHGSERFLGKVALSARLKVFLLSVPVDQCRREMFLERSCCISRVGSVGRRRWSDLAVSKDMPE